MNYPVWELTTIGGGSLIALIAVLHVFISHLAVGGGLFLWLTDWKGFREKNPRIHDYVKKHTWFFLLLTIYMARDMGVCDICQFANLLLMIPKLIGQVVSCELGGRGINLFDRGDLMKR